MKRFGIFCEAFLPFVFIVVLQYAATSFVQTSTITLDSFNPAFYSNSETSLDALYDYLLGTQVNMLILLVYTLFGICLFGCWYYSRLGGEFAPSRVLRYFTGRRIASVLLLGLGLQLLATLVSIPVYYIAPSLAESYEQLTESSGISEISFLMIAYGVIAGPICEELIFRGVIMRLFSRVTRHFWIANILQAVLFGYYHHNWFQGIYTFFLGMVFGLICEKGGTIYYSMIVHISFNLFGAVISNLVSPYLDFPGGEILYMVIPGIGLIAGIILFVKGKPAPKYTPEQVSSSSCEI